MQLYRFKLNLYFLDIIKIKKKTKNCFRYKIFMLDLDI